MLTNIPGYPRIGSQRELKKACENYWAGKISLERLELTSRQLRKENWIGLQEAGIDLIPSNDFSWYDQVLDMCMILGVIPSRFKALQQTFANPGCPELYFAMARGYQKNNFDITALEMTKWFDTNYHYLVPEFESVQQYTLHQPKCVEEFKEALSHGITTKPVLIGPVTFILCGKIKGDDLTHTQLLEKLLPVYIELLRSLQQAGATWIQLDEPFLVTDLDPATRDLYHAAYTAISQALPALSILLTTYFGALEDNTTLALQLPVQAVHIDLVRAPEQLDTVLAALPADKWLSLGVVDGRNIWKNDYAASVALIEKAIQQIGEERVLLGTSCSLLHVPYNLEDETALDPEVKQWMAFAKQKVAEVIALKHIIAGDTSLLIDNETVMNSRKISSRIHQPEVKARLESVTTADTQRHSIFPHRQKLQQSVLQLPLFPTTTIGSFPQTTEIRQLRADLKKGIITPETYNADIRNAITETIYRQESLGLDVLVHGEFERNDMVEYFGEQLDGFVFTQNGWVQSYGTRCVKPPVIFGDVQRPEPMTVAWSRFAQSLTSKPVKGMLTGPITILQWSFVRNDQPRMQTTMQIALAIRDEVKDLEDAGITIIQVDEPALREGLPLRKAQRAAYLSEAVKAFRLAVSTVDDSTQIHTHMCYAEFNDIIAHIAAMDADVITIETSRSQMELLEAFAGFKYPNETGPGVYDIHSPRVPAIAEMEALLHKAAALLPLRNIWVNPDCGLKTRKWPETEMALRNMVTAAKNVRLAMSN
ncbi:5-methyltetrahydropteroyltriglutamate--homocysteine S-methyltransferase [Chitinophaga ginsengisegetis]|uniref:5-methyltetrahydropteroyltriglutamate-- homocysteine S-methyltransferase n=1 Tax=Chitinophaga ginsengisegetis TaxID=393003 RepID=UPI000DBA7C25|nr:5-methyltetrahydropteroyltriglutamate--homocysteine S-methyltransferase [Chitinophaga ginsengisegetis]MDR6567150.1 5-methyltetrahydropteroyltriglutamate--homocysteine methyltransferase [Chitinophaga ginsengisegetis]MDR6646880.1 5-methyltetrahydropteroyltriglutamate--homocysteine methyltransferase [Chitinophaga ginsengisegetis]MDR6653230.1 5-methyltetrahydropteroyltriglutamate--homocysteine methyltransferase [Chitinophaga ginsengisegetis]